jgi:sec-independent protein translocase protein TatA
MRALFDSPAAIILLLLVIVLFGARRLPDAAKSVGKSIKAFKSEMETDKSGEVKSSDPDSTDTTKP